VARCRADTAGLDPPGETIRNRTDSTRQPWLGSRVTVLFDVGLRAACVVHPRPSPVIASPKVRKTRKGWGASLSCDSLPICQANSRGPPAKLLQPGPERASSKKGVDEIDCGGCGRSLWLWPVSDRATLPTAGLRMIGRPSVGPPGGVRRPATNWDELGGGRTAPNLGSLAASLGFNGSRLCHFVGTDGSRLGHFAGAGCSSATVTVSITSPCLILLTTSWPSITWPKTECLPSR
jgi:hypothetical protein